MQGWLSSSFSVTSLGTFYVVGRTQISTKRRPTRRSDGATRHAYESSRMHDNALLT